MLDFLEEAPWWTGFVAIFCVIAVVLITSIALFGSAGEAERRAQLRVEARDLWLSECHRPLDACARSWDEIHTLRHLYVERIDAARKSDYGQP